MERPELRGTAMFDLTVRRRACHGAGRGMGRSMAPALAAAGADVAVSARTTDEIESLAEEIRGLGKNARAFTPATSQTMCSAMR